MSGGEAGAAVSGGEAEAAGATGAVERALDTVPGRISGGTLGLCLAAVLVGGVAFLLGVDADPDRTWQIAWVNFLFWVALAQCGVVFGAALQTAKGHWGKGFRRVAEGAGAFLPVALLIFAGLYFGAEHVLPWAGDPDAHVNETWLSSVEGVFLRNGLLLLAITALSLWFMRLSLRPDARMVAERLDGWRRTLVGKLASDWRGDDREVAASRKTLGWLSPLLCLAYAVVFSLLAVDMAMSLMPEFLSMVWGAYFFIGGWLALLGLTAVMANRYYWRYGLEDVWDRWQFHDLGKLLFAFTIFWAYLWWSQFLVIWYGNLPYETLFFEQRTAGSYSALYTLQMVLVFGIPFLLLLFRKPKMNPGYLAFVAVISLAGLWLERYLLVIPSTWHGEGLPLGWIEVGVSLGFLGLFALCYALYSSTFPKMPIREVLSAGEASTGP